MRRARARTNDGVDEDRTRDVEPIVDEGGAEADARDQEDDGIEQVGRHLVEGVQKVLDLRGKARASAHVAALDACIACIACVACIACGECEALAVGWSCRCRLVMRWAEVGASL